MRDPRLERYAEILIDTCVGVQPGWQVIVSSGPPGRPLVEEIAGQIAKRGAYALIRLNISGSIPWILEAPDELLKNLPSIELYAFQNADALIAIDAPENTREASVVPPERMGLMQSSIRPVLERAYTNDLAWVGCNYPTPAFAQAAGMSLWFVPPISGRPLPSARWIVPSIFSSKSVFFMKRVMPGLQPMPSSPSRRAPSSRSSCSNRNSSFASAEASTTFPPANRSRMPRTSRPA